MKLFIYSILGCFFINATGAQQVSGTILSGIDQKPLGNVSVFESGSKKGTTTNDKGYFSLTAKWQGKIQLQFSHTGFQTKDTTLEISGTGTINLQIVLEEAGGELDEVIIVSSSRTNSRIEDLPTKVEVLGSEEVHEENGIKPGNIASLLGDIAGIQIQQTSAATGNADMRIQGLQGKYTQLLRDGMPLFGGYAGSFSILQIPPLDLQQIELVKGASSTLYGGGAIAGMVNLVSKRPKLNKAERSFTINRSTLKENNLNLYFSERNQKAGYTFFAGGTLQKEVDVDKDGFSDLPSVKSILVHPRLFLYNNPSSTVIIGYTLNYEDRNGGDMQVLNKQSSSAHQFFIQNKSLRNTADLTWEKKLPGNAQLTAKTSVSFLNRKVNTNVFGMIGNQLTWYGELAYAKKWEKHNLVTGINFNGENFTKKEPDSSLLPNERNNTLGFFVQDDWKFNDQFILQSGLRIDATNNYGVFVLPRLSLLYKLSHEITMRIGGGLGYKTPTLFNAEIDERDYHYLTGYAPGTKAEHSIGANYDVNYKTKAGKWELTLNQTFFYNSIQQPLLYSKLATTTPVFYYQNAGDDLRTWGFETYLQAMKEPWELYLGYVYTNAKRKYNTVNPNLPLIARNKLATVIAYSFSDDFRAGIESAYTGKQFLDNGTTTTPYLFTALMLRYNIGKAAFVLNCENLFDYRQNKNGSLVQPPLTNPGFPEIWAPLDGRVINLSMYLKW
ncbi:MAG: hypothetical protein RLZZ28_1256 [Bacteroidota bacterium]